MPKSSNIKELCQQCIYKTNIPYGILILSIMLNSEYFQMSAAAKGRFRSPETIAKWRESMIKRKNLDF